MREVIPPCNVRSVFLGVLYTFFILIGSNYTYAQEFIAASGDNQNQLPSQENENLKPLTTVLAELEIKYKVSFAFETLLVKDKLVDQKDAGRINPNSLEKTLQAILSPLALKYEKLGKNYYLIYSASEKKLINKIDKKYPDSTGQTDIRLPDAIENITRQKITLLTSKAITINGKVTNEQGEGLPGVNVLLKASTIGTSTDVNGNYSISVPDGSGTLVFSYIGFVAKEVVIGNQSTIDVTLLLDTRSLSEVVVVGYGTQQQREVTGAVASVGARDINQVAVTGLDQALQGRMAGVQVTQNSGEPGGSVSVKIRGVGSLSAGTEPLYIVDGIPLAGSLNAINPNDIERIDVLKDAASAAIYGSRGTNGVVIVTTKRGKAGRIAVNLDAYYGVQSAAKKLKLLNGPDFARLANDNLRNAGIPTNPEWDSPSQPTYDWQDAVLQKSAIQSYNVSISGGNERSRTFFSAGYFNQGGIIIGSDYKRYTTRLNTDYDLGKRMRVGATFNLAYDVKNAVPTESGFAGVLVNAAQLQPNMPIYTNQEGVINDHFYGWEGYNFISKTAPVNFYPSGLNNEVHTNKAYFKRPQTNLQLLAAFFAEYEILNGLKFRSTINLTLGNSFNYFSQRKSPDELASVGQYRNLSGYGEGWSRFDQWNWINTLTYTKTFGRNSFSIIAGTDALKNNSRGVGITTVGNPDDQLSINASSNTGRVVTGAPADFSLVSYFSRLTYDYAGKYLATVNFRRDGSSKFGPTYRYGNFPSASVGWLVSEEPFMDAVPFLSELKLRASYGVVGNQNIGNFLYLNTYSADAGTYQYTIGDGQTAVPALYPNNIGDPNIRWEKSIQTNIGLDALLWMGKVTFTADYFIKDLKDLLGYVPIPSYTGVYGGSVFRNGFSMQNKGIELALGTNQQFGEVSFSATANFSSLDNKITQLTSSEKSYVSTSISVNPGLDDNAQTRSQVGERIANFWGYQTDGIFQNQGEVDAGGMGGVKPGDRRFKDLNGDGKINSDDKTILGNGLPRYIYGLNLRAAYKGFDLTTFFTGQADVKVANMTKFFLYNMRYNNVTGITNGSQDLLNSWTPENPGTTMPRNSYDAPNSNRYFSTYYIENAAFVRLRNLQIGYTLPAGFSKRMAMNQARIYLAAQNLFTITKYSGYDPEVGSANVNGGTDKSPLTTGVDFGRYPVARIFMAGINFQF